MGTETHSRGAVYIELFVMFDKKLIPSMGTETT